MYNIFSSFWMPWHRCTTIPCHRSTVTPLHLDTLTPLHGVTVARHTVHILLLHHTLNVLVDSGSTWSHGTVWHARTSQADGPASDVTLLSFTTTAFCNVIQDVNIEICWQEGIISQGISALITYSIVHTVRLCDWTGTCWGRVVSSPVADCRRPSALVSCHFLSTCCQLLTIEASW